MDPFDPRRSALFADMSAIAAAAVAWEHGSRGRATFEVSFPRLPANRGFVVTAGVEQVVHYLLDFAFEPEQVHFVRNLFPFHKITDGFWDFLGTVRFTGDLWSAPEGTPIFAQQPFLRIVAPLPEAQLFETYVLSTLAHQCVVATKVARMVEAAGSCDVVDLGSRFAHGPNAGPAGARVSYTGGGAGTSNLEASHRLGVPIYAALARAFVDAFPSEEEAFRNYAERFPGSAILPLDPLDPVASAQRLASLNLPVRSVRLDGKESAVHAAPIRAILNAAGQRSIKIMLSGDIDEYDIAEIVASGAPINEFGVGLHLQTASDSPALALVYELVAIESNSTADAAIAPPSVAKNLCGPRQIYRRFSASRVARGDTVAAVAAKAPLGAPVLAEVLRDGKPATGRPGLETIRDYTRRAVNTLPPEVRRLREPQTYEVTHTVES